MVDGRSIWLGCLDLSPAVSLSGHEICGMRVVVSSVSGGDDWAADAATALRQVTRSFVFGIFAGVEHPAIGGNLMSWSLLLV